MKILIVGGGIAGLSAAIALQGDGYDITIVEALDGWEPAGAGLHLPGNAITALKSLGIDQDVAAKSCAFPRLDYFDHRDRKLFAVETEKLGWPTFQALSRSDFHDILCAKLTTPKIDFGLSVSEINDENDQAQVTFTDGTQNAFDLVIGADGINSTVRQLAFGTDPPPPTDRLYLLALDYRLSIWPDCAKIHCRPRAGYSGDADWRQPVLYLCQHF